MFAADSVDYLASENSPSIVQHFWSLGVEEQLYIAWPVMLLLFSVWLGRKSGLVAAMVPVTIVAIASFAYSSLMVYQSNPVGYFSTFSRAWEFALGAMVAAVAVFRPASLRMKPAAAKVMAWTGWITLVVFTLVFDARHGFPGWWALIPALGTLAIIIANNPDSNFGLSKIVQLKPIQFLGDASYSIYLWHWPLLVVAGFYFPRIPWYWLATIFFATILFAYLSMRFIENPFRFGSISRLRPRVVLASVATSMALVVSGTQIGSGAVAGAMAAEEEKVAAVEKLVAERLVTTEEQDLIETEPEPIWDEVTCMGPASLVQPECSEISWDTFVPAVGAFDRTAHEIEPLAMSGSKIGCLAWKDRFDLITCTFGVLGGERWVLLGDSHAYQWLPAMNIVAGRNNIELIVMARAGCPPNTTKRDATWDLQQGCLSWQGEVLDWFAEDRQVSKVIVSNFSATTFLGGLDKWTLNERAITGYQEFWSEISARGAELIAFRDTPFPGEETWECIERNPQDPSVCDVDRVRMERVADDTREAATRLGLPIVDMWDYFCEPDVCHIVNGGILTYKDSNHFSGTYGLLLAEYLEGELEVLELLPSGD